MDDRVRNTLALAFKHRAKGFCEITDSRGQADAILFDMDSSDAQADWEAIQKQHPSIPKVIISQHRAEIDSVPQISKPISVNGLLDAISSVTGRTFDPTVDMRPPSSSSAAAALLGKRVVDVARGPSAQFRAPANPATPLTSFYYDREAFLEGLLLQALDEARLTRQAVSLSCFAGNRIVLVPRDNLVYTNIDDETMRYLGDASLAALGISWRDLEWMDPKWGVVTAQCKSLEAKALDGFMWELSVMTSQGRAPVGISIDELVYLKHWPNLTRYHFIPESMRIASLWSRQPTSLLTLRQLLDIPFEYILSFYSAASAVGLAGALGQDDGSAVNNTAAAHEGSGEHTTGALFGSILRRLSGKLRKTN